MKDWKKFKKWGNTSYFLLISLILGIKKALSQELVREPNKLKKIKKTQKEKPNSDHLFLTFHNLIMIWTIVEK